MERELEYNTELTKIKHTNYVRNTRAIVVLWAIFVVIYLVLNIVVFLQPQWIGDTGDSAVAGFFGLWEYCQESGPGLGYTCDGDFLDWNSMLNDSFKATSMMVGISCILFLISIGCFVLFCLLNTATVLRVCAWFQVIAGILMFLSCVVFPSGWDHSEIKHVCGPQADGYELGTCSLRWGYVLAIVLIFDAFILAILAFVLAGTQANLLPDEYKSEKEPIKD